MDGMQLLLELITDTREGGEAGADRLPLFAKPSRTVCVLSRLQPAVLALTSRNTDHIPTVCGFWTNNHIHRERSELPGTLRAFSFAPERLVIVQTSRLRPALVLIGDAAGRLWRSPLPLPSPGIAPIATAESAHINKGVT